MECSKSVSGILLFIILIFLSSCLSRNNGDESGITDKTKYDQYMVLGKNLFQENCGNCHQDDGSGLRRLYPPLQNSDFLQKDLTEILCVIRYGKKDSITVNGVTFDQGMPDNPELTNLDIAAISTYVMSNFGKKPVLIEPDDIQALSGKCH
jgi:cytochrome c551